MIGLVSESGKSNSRFQLGNRGRNKLGFRFRASSARPRLSGEWLHQDRLRISSISPKTRLNPCFISYRCFQQCFLEENRENITYRQCSENISPLGQVLKAEIAKLCHRKRKPLPRKNWERPLLHPPKAGENTLVLHRSFQQQRQDELG